MPSKKLEEKEEELDIKKSEKKESFATRWFNDHAVNNKTELRIVSELTARSIWDQFRIHLRTKNNEVYGVIFYGIFISIMEFLKKQEVTNNTFTIAIANSVNLGFTNNTNESNEKSGNFTPIMEHIGINVNYLIEDESTPNWYRMNSDNENYRANKAHTNKGEETDKITRRYISWKNTNIKHNAQYINTIQADAYQYLIDQFRINIRTQEAVIPIFCIFMDNIVNVLKQKYREAEGTDVSEVKMNVFGLFDVYYSYDADADKEIIDFEPNILMKLSLKSDDQAAKHLS